MSVPRNIDPAVGGLAHVALYSIDDLEGLARRGVQARERELAACHQIIEAHVGALIEKLHTEEAQSPWRSAPRQLSTKVLIPQPTQQKSTMVCAPLTPAIVSGIRSRDCTE